MTDRASNQYCNRYMDDAPGVRADCEAHLSSGRACVDCRHRNIRAEVRDLRARLQVETSELIRRGDEMAHELGKFGRSTDGWWAARGAGGHMLCTVCSPEEPFDKETLRLAKAASERVAGPVSGNPIADWKLGEEPSQVKAKELHAPDCQARLTHELGFKTLSPCTCGALNVTAGHTK